MSNTIGLAVRIKILGGVNMDINCGNEQWAVFIREQTNTDYIRIMDLVDTIEQSIKDILVFKKESSIERRLFNGDHLIVFIKKFIEKNEAKITVYDPALMAKMGNVSNNDTCKILAAIDYFNQGPRITNHNELFELIDAIIYINPDRCKEYYHKLKDSIINGSHDQHEVEKLYEYSLDFNDKSSRGVIRDLLLSEYFRPQLLQLTSTRQIDDFQLIIKRKFYTDDFANFIRYEIPEKRLQLETNKQCFTLSNDLSDTIKVTRLNDARGYLVKEVYDKFSFSELEDFLYSQSCLLYHAHNNELFKNFLLQFGQLDDYSHRQFDGVNLENDSNLFEQYAKLFSVFQVGRMRFDNTGFIDTKETLVDFIAKIVKDDGGLNLIIKFGSQYCDKSKFYFSQAFTHILETKTIKKIFFTTLSDLDNKQIINLLSDVNKNVFLTIFKTFIIQFFKNKPNTNEIQSMRNLIFNINDEKLFNTILLKRAEISTI